MPTFRSPALGLTFGLLLAAYAGAFPARPDATPVHAAAIGGGALVPNEERLLPDPFPIQRVFSTPERAEAANRDAARGALKKLAKSDFEGMVQAASRVRESAKNPSRILEAVYRAALLPGRVTGTAEWRLIHPTRRACAMPVDPLPGAVMAPRWADGQTPLLFRAIPEGKIQGATYLGIESPAQDRFSFEWSVRTVEQLDDERCTLTFPPSPIAALELVLPADRVPVVGQPGVLLTGPFPASKSEERLWKLAFGGQTRIGLAFRKSRRSEDARTPVYGTRAAVWNLTRTEFAARFEFAFRPGRLGARPQTFLVDTDLEVVGVAGASVEKWDWVSEGDRPRVLRVRHRDGAPPAPLTVHARAVPVRIPSVWIPPQIRPADGSLGGDTIGVQVASDYRLEGWQANDYRLGSTATDADRTTRLEFLPALSNAEGRVERKPPAVRLRPADQDFATVETLDWRLEPSRSKLSANFATAVSHGPIPSFSFRASAGFVLESAALVPDDPGLAFGAVPGLADVWFVEPSRAVGSGQRLEIRLVFRGGGVSEREAGEPVPFPKLSPVGAGERKGTLSVRPSGGLKVSTAGLSLAATPFNGEPGFSVAYRGREPDGTLLVTRSQPMLSAAVEVEVTDGPASVGMATTLRGRAEGAPLDSLLVRVPSLPAKWRIEPSADAVRVPGDLALPWLAHLGTGTRWGALAFAALPPPEGTLWRIAFAKPVVGEFSCAIGWEQPRPDGSLPRLPLPRFREVPIARRTAKLDPALADGFRSEFETDASAAPIALILEEAHRPPAPAPASGSWDIREVKLQNRLGSGSRLECTLRGTVARPGAARLPIAIDCERLESALVDGKWIGLTARELAEYGLPISKAGSEFEIAYSRTFRASVFGLPSAVESPTPVLPGDPEISRTWTLAPEVREWPGLTRYRSDPDTDGLRVVKASTVRIGSWLASAGFALAAFFGPLGRWGGWRFPLIFSAAVALGITCGMTASAWAEALHPPLATAFACTAVALCRRPRRLASTAIPTWFLAFAATLSAGMGLAQAPEPVKVYVVPGPAEHPDRWRVFVPKATLDMLETSARSPLPDAAILSADYDCLARGDAVSVTAKYSILSHKADEQTLSLPSAGVRLEKAVCDGRPAFPDASRPDRFLLPISGAGRHELILHFAVTVRPTGAERDATFAVPDLPVSHVSFAAGLRGRQLDVQSRSGGQSLGVSTEGLRVEAEHGGGGTIRLRWREGGAAEGAKPTVTVKEGAVWDLGEAESLLTAVWQYRVAGGTLSSLQIQLPEHVLPSHVGIEASEGAIADLGIRSWSLGKPAGGTVPMTVRLRNPTDGRFALIVRGHSTKSPAAKPVLNFPWTSDVPEADRDSFHAVRYYALRAEGVTVSGAIDFPAEAVARDFPTVPEFDFAKLPPARVVRRAAGKSTELRPMLVPVPAYQPIAAEMVCTLGRKVEVEGAMRASIRDSGSMEFDLPAGLILADVWSPGLAGWSRSGSRIQAWWGQPSGDVVLRWSGQLPRGSTPEAVCELPLPRWPSAVAKQAGPWTVRVRPAPGWTVAPPEGSGWRNSPPSSPGEWSLTSEAEPFPLVPPKFSARALPKPIAGAEGPKAAPPASVASPAPAVPAAPVAGPVAERGEVRQYLRLEAWLFCSSMLVVFHYFGGRRGRPETFLFMGLSAAVAIGPELNSALPFWGIAGYGVLLRVVRIAGRGVRFTFR